MKREKQKVIQKKADIIIEILLISIVVLLAYHMFSYFLRLVYAGENVADEFSTIMHIVRYGDGSISDWIYWPIVLILKIQSVFFSDIKIYKGFILIQIIINILIIWLFYHLLIRIFYHKLSVVTLFFISVGFYMGMPAYCFLCGNSIKGSMGLILFLVSIIIAYQILRWYRKIWNILPNIIWKGMAIVSGIAATAFLCVGFGGDFVYFVPVVAIVIVEAYWRGSINKFLCTIYMIVILIEGLIMFAIGAGEIDTSLKLTMASFYWCVSWLIVAQAIVVVKKKKQVLELGVYGGLLLVLLLLQVFEVDDKIRENHRDLVRDEEIFAADYFGIYGANINYIKTDYTDESSIFFGSAEFIDLAEQAMSYSKDELLVLSDEITETDRTWFTAITDRDYVEIDGLNSTDEDISKVLREQNPEYVVIFTNSRIYMAHYEFVSGYPHIYENDRGMILERPGDGW